MSLLATALLVGSALASTTAVAQTCLTTLFTGGSSGSPFGRMGAYINVSVTANVIVQSIRSNFQAAAGTPVTIEVWTTPNTYIGNEGNQAAWTLRSIDTGGVVTAGPGNQTVFTLATPFQLATGSYGMTIIAIGSTSYRYSTGGPTPYTDGTMTITTGGIDTTPFNGGVSFSPRQWNGAICYQLAMGIFANFTANRTRVGPGGTVNFTDTTFTSDPGGVIAWSWDLNGDGVYGDSTLQNPNFVYGTCGLVNVSLTATDAAASNTITKTGYINVDVPIASFTAAPPLGQPAGPVPVVVNFTDTSAADPTSWSWDLDGDGLFGDSTLQNPSWVYATVGTTTVRLIATNACGSSTAATGRVDTRTGLCTLFAQDNGGNAGGAVYFDVTVANPAGITVTALDTNFAAAAGTANVGLTVYCRPGTAFGNELSIAGWSLAASGTGTAAGVNNRTTIDVTNFALAPGSYGIALVSSANSGGHSYTNGTPANQTFMNTDLTIRLGSANNVAFAATPAAFTPRIWNGCVIYDVGGSPASWSTQNQTGCPLNGVEPSVNLAAGQRPVTNSTWMFEFNNGPANGAGFVSLGFQQVGVPLDLGIVGAQPGCSLGINPIVFLANVPLNASGFGTYNLNVRHDPSAHGVTMLVQGLTLVLTQPFPLPVFASDTYAALVGSN